MGGAMACRARPVARRAAFLVAAPSPSNRDPYRTKRGLTVAAPARPGRRATGASMKRGLVGRMRLKCTARGEAEPATAAIGREGEPPDCGWGLGPVGHSSP